MQENKSSRHNSVTAAVSNGQTTPQALTEVENKRHFLAESQSCMTPFCSDELVSPPNLYPPWCTELPPVFLASFHPKIPKILYKLLELIQFNRINYMHFYLRRSVIQNLVTITHFLLNHMFPNYNTGKQRFLSYTFSKIIFSLTAFLKNKQNSSFKFSFFCYVRPKYTRGWKRNILFLVFNIQTSIFNIQTSI